MCGLSYLEVLPTLYYHFTPPLSHLSALTCPCTSLPSPPRLVSCIDISLTCLFCFLVKNACIKKQCPSNAICQAGFSSEGYRCVCVPGYTGKDCTEGEADICFQYLRVSSHSTIRKVSDHLFYLKSLVLSSCIYFLVEDKEGPAVN